MRLTTSTRRTQMTRRIPPDFHLTKREADLVRLANLDPDMKPDGFFRIDYCTFQCDRCEQRIPHNGKEGDSAVTDCYITIDEAILCRICWDECPDLHPEDNEPIGPDSPGLATGGELQ